MSEKTTVGTDDWLRIAKQMVSEIKFGSISIIVQDGRIVQIEQNKKIRL